MCSSDATQLTPARFPSFYEGVNVEKFHALHRPPHGPFMPRRVFNTEGWSGWAMQKPKNRHHKRDYYDGILLGANMNDPREFLVRARGSNLMGEVQFRWSTGGRDRVRAIAVVLMTPDADPPTAPL